jgi:RimJ/RimL family protein N-acetyltransferase
VTTRDLLPEEIAIGRILLRQPAGHDLGALVEGANNWNIIAPTATLPFPYLEEHGKGFIERFSRKPDRRSYVIANRVDDRVIGVIGLNFADKHAPELGYWIAQSHWGQGFAPEAVTGLLGAVRQAAFQTIRAKVLESNPASLRVLQKTGFALVERTQSSVERHLGKPLLILEWQP